MLAKDTAGILLDIVVGWGCPQNLGRIVKIVMLLMDVAGMDIAGVVANAVVQDCLQNLEHAVIEQLVGW